jgi:hypothetical protein
MMRAHWSIYVRLKGLNKKTQTCQVKNLSNHERPILFVMTLMESYRKQVEVHFEEEAGESDEDVGKGLRNLHVVLVCHVERDVLPLMRWHKYGDQFIFFHTKV